MQNKWRKQILTTLYKIDRKDFEENVSFTHIISNVDLHSWIGVEKNFLQPKSLDFLTRVILQIFRKMFFFIS